MAESIRKTSKEIILETATRLASIAGIEGLTIGELAKAVGMSKSGLFAHFKGKDHLQLMVLEKAVEKFVDVVMKPAFREAPGEPRIRSLVRRWINHLDNEAELPGGSVLISASIELDDRPGPLRDYVKRVQQELMKNLDKSARIAVEAGHFRKDLDTEQFAWTMYSYVLGYHHFRRMLEDPKAETHLMKAFDELLKSARDESIQKVS